MNLLPERAPDNQPTSSIKTFVQTEVERLHYWERVHEMNKRSLKTSTEAVAHQREQADKWERILAIRLAEEAQTVEVTGL